MLRIGEFEVADLLSQTGLVAVYAAHKPPEKTNQYAIKVLCPPSEWLIDPERFRRQRDRFLASVTVQERLTRAKARHWAPIYQRGTTDQGVYYVTDRFEQSLQYLIDGQVRLNGEMLGTIVVSVINGLLELQHERNRPHGNLKPSNILVRRRHSSALAHLALTDPLPDESIQSSFPTTDLRRLGELIYVLATKRQASETPGWQIPDEDNWSHLGFGWQKWKTLCNQLLNAPSKTDAIPLETVLYMANRMRRHPKIVRRVVCVSCCSILCLFAAIMIYLHFFRPAGPEDWWKACAENILWIQKLRTDKLNDQIPKEISLLIQGANWHPEGKNDFSQLLPDLSKPKEVAPPEGKVGPQLDQIRKLREYLYANSSSSKAGGWELLKNLRRSSQERIMKNSTALATAMKTIVASVQPPDPNTIDMILEEAKNKDKKDVMKKLDDLSKQYSKIGTNILCIHDHHTALEHVGNLIDKIQEHSAEIRKSGGPFALLADKIEEEFKNKSDKDLVTPLANNTLRIEEESLRQWRSEFTSFVSQVDEMRSLITKDSVDTIRLKEDVDSGKLNVTSTLQQWADAIRKYAEKDDAWLKRHRAMKFIESGSLNAKWESHLNDFQNIMNDNVSNTPLFDLRNSIEKLFTGLDRINDKRQQIANRLPKNLNHDWADLRMLHKQAIEDVLKEFLSDILINTTDEEIVNKRISDPNTIPELTSFETATDGLVQLIDRYTVLLTRMESAYRISDPETFEAAHSFQDARKQLNHPAIRLHVLGSNSSVEALFHKLEKRIALQEDIESKNPNELLEVIRSGEFIECRYAAWLKLGSMNLMWPSAMEWGKEAEAFNLLLTQLTLLKDRNPGALKEFENEGNRRIQVYHQNVMEILKASYNELSALIDKNGKSVQEGQTYPGLITFLNHWDSKIQAYSDTVNDVKLDLDRGSLLALLDESMADPNSIRPAVRRLENFLRSPEWNNPEKYDRDRFMLDEVNKEDSNILRWPQSLIDIFTQYEKLSADYWNTIQEEMRMLKTDLDNEEHEPEVDDLFTTANNMFTEAKNIRLIKLRENELDEKRKYLVEQLKLTRDSLTPPFGRGMKLENNKVVFKESELAEFEPIFLNEDETVPWNQKKDKWLTLESGPWRLIKERTGNISLANEMQKWQTGEMKTQWETVKLDTTAALQDQFFCNLNRNEPSWPRYIRSIKDPSVILRYIPDAKPFYMSIREITAQQYVSFLNTVEAELISRKTSASQFIVGRSPGWINWGYIDGQYDTPIKLVDPPSTEIQYEINTHITADTPISFVSFDGAQAYAGWLAPSLGGIPTDIQHRLACRGGASTLLPWLNDEQNISTFAFLGGNSWKDAIDIYNNNLPSTTIAIPYGCIQPIDYIEYGNRFSIDTLDVDQQKDLIWPHNTTTHANPWGLHDMLGNVWEWCTVSNSNSPGICGYSCLTPKPYIEQNGKYYCLYKDEQGNDSPSPNGYRYKIGPDIDIGFRVIVKLP